MRTSKVKLIRRLLMTVIGIVLVGVALNYVYTLRRRVGPIKRAARILSSELARSADWIEYSEHENGKLRFKIRADRLLETRHGESLLQGIEAFDFNPDGSVRNQISSRKAEYDNTRKKAVFTENVRIRLTDGSELLTDSLRYDLGSNVGETEDIIRFTSKQISGTARGLRYDRGQQGMELHNDVHFTILRTARAQDGSIYTENLRAESQRGLYSQARQTVSFHGNAHLTSSTASLSGEDIEAVFSADSKHLKSLVAQGGAIYESREPGSQRTLRGRRISFGISEADGALETIDVQDDASLQANDSEAQQELRGREIHMRLDAGSGLPVSVLCQSAVSFRLQRGQEDSLVTGDRLEANFVPATNLLQTIVVRDHAGMTRRIEDKSGSESLRAREIRINFKSGESRNVVHHLEAEGSVRWDSSPEGNTQGRSGQPGRSLTASFLRMNYAEAGDFLESVNASGNVTIVGEPSETGKESEIRRLDADNVLFHFYAGVNRLKELEGEGHVRLTYRKPADQAGALSQDSHTSSSNILATFLEADGTMQTVSQWGAFVYQDGQRTARSGRGDYNAGTQMLVLRESPEITDANGSTTGDVVEYDQNKRVVSVRRHVRSVLRPTNESKGMPFAASPGSSAPTVVLADEMQYWTIASRAHYVSNVQVLSENGQLQARTLDILNAGARLEAQGDIRHVVPGRQGSTPKTVVGKSATKNDHSSPPTTIRSETLRYDRQENAIHYSGKVELHSDDVEMSSNSLDAVLGAEGGKIERAAATGNVTIRQQGREAKGDSAEYDTLTEKFVVKGNLAQVFDPERGKSYARRLTFSKSDDRILLENR